MPALSPATNNRILSESNVRELKRSLKLRRALRCHYLAGCTVMLLASTGAEALELGEANVRGSLGDPLHVEIPVQVAPNESLRSECLSLVSTSTGLPSFSNATVALRGNVIAVSSQQVVKEPIIGLDLRVNCQGAPHLVRSYQLFVDPRPLVAAPGSESRPMQNQPAAAIVRRQPRVDSRPATVSRQARGLSGTNIAAGSNYEVRAGDTLSGIAARIGNRNVSLWRAVDTIFAANPDAFDNGDLNNLRAGAVIEIPLFGTASQASVAAAQVSVADTLAPPVAAPTILPGVIDSAFSSEKPPAVDAAKTLVESPITTDTATTEGDAVAESATNSTAAESSTDSAAFDVRSPFVIREEVAPIAPAEVETMVQDESAQTTPGWVTGLIAIGSALALTLMLVLFMRRRKPESMPDFIDAPLPAKGNAVPRARMAENEDTTEEAALDPWENEATDAFPKNVDANGFTDSLSCLDESSDSFSLDITTNKEALDLAFEAPASAESVDLDVGNAPPASQSSETGVTLTRRSTSESDITMADLDMLTKDYEAELTATQQLNEELATAVANLKAADASANGDTNEMPAAEFDDAETAFLEEVEIPDELRWDDQTRANAQLMTEELLEDATFTVAVEGEADTAEMPAARQSGTEEPIYDEADGLDTARSPTLKFAEESSEEDEWEAFTRAASAGDRS